MSRTNFKKFFVDLSVSGSEETVGENLSKHGVCTFHVGDKSGIVSLVNQIGSSVKHAGTDQDGIMTIFPDVSRVKIGAGNGGAYGRDLLPFHTDGKGISECFGQNGEKRYGPADILILHAQQIIKPEEAVPMICDGCDIYSELEKNRGEVLHYLMGGDAVQNYETLPNHRYSGPLIQMIQGRVTLRLDPDLCSHWPAGYRDAFMEITRQKTLEIILRTGDGYILDNRRMLHGRGPIGDNNPRTLHHVLVYPEVDKPVGKHIFSYSLSQG